MIRINLLPVREAERALGRRRQIALAILMGTVVLLMMLLPYTFQARRLGQHLALEWHGGEHVIEGGLPIGRDHDAPSIGKVIGIAHLATLEVGQLGKISVGQAVPDLPADQVGAADGANGQRRSPA